MSKRTFDSTSFSVVSATYFTRYLTRVFGTPAFTPYIDIWSPLYVAHPRASSDKSPVPITKAPSLFDVSIKT